MNAAAVGTPLNGCVLHRLTPADAAAMAGCERRVQPTPWTAGMVNDSLAAGAEGHWLAAPHEMAAAPEMVAYVLAQPTVDETELLTLGVLPHWRRRGLAAFLLARVVEAAKARGDARLLLEVRASNLGAQAFYRQQGFTAIGRRPGYYPTADGREAALVMAKKL